MKCWRLIRSCDKINSIRSYDQLQSAKQIQVRIMEGWVTYRHNRIKVNSLEDFAKIRGAVRESGRDVYFVRMLGRSAAYCLLYTSDAADE